MEDLFYIKENLAKIKSKISEDVCLVAVSKTHPVSFIQFAYETGQIDFGENKVQELCDKAEQLPKDIKWHLIGHLQSNKVKYIAPFVYLIHSVDSEKLLKEINKEAEKNNRNIDCLIQVHIAEEDTKFGFDINEAKYFIENTDFETDYKNVKIRGLMGMATFTEDKNQIKREFYTLKKLFDQIENSQKFDDSFDTLSMGMSGDFDIAIDCGSNMIRVGSTIFGNRNYH
jgi:PLP dependent protein